MNKVLVVLIGNARGGEEAWTSLYSNVLDVYNADLCLCFGKTDDRRSSLYAKAKYLWEIPDYNNWKDFYAQYFDYDNSYLRKTFDLGHDSGLSGGIDNRPGSGSIIFAFRYYIKQYYLDVLQQYEHIILTRSDHLYTYPHPNQLSTDNILVVEGEDYGGITDRHHIFPSKYAKEMLGVIDYMNTEVGYNEMLNVYRPNPEQVLLSSFKFYNIEDKINRFPRFQFTVALYDDMIRWSKTDIPVPGMPNLFLKYQSEHQQTLNNHQLLLNEDRTNN